MIPGIPIHTAPSPFGTLVVHDHGDERYMAFAGSESYLSCVRRQYPRDLVFPYTKAMASCLLLAPAPRRILCVGLGAGSLPGALAHLCPDAHVDSVEINPTVTALAKGYFGFIETERCRVHTADARAFIEEAAGNGMRYDAILLDAFDSEYVPPHLDTPDFFQSVANALAPGGAVMGNIFSTHAGFPGQLATYQAAWPQAHLLRLAGGNAIVAATREWPGEAVLRRRAAAWEVPMAQVAVPIAQYPQRYQPIEPGDLLPPGETWTPRSSAGALRGR